MNTENDARSWQLKGALVVDPFDTDSTVDVWPTIGASKFLISVGLSSARAGE
jgi:hypothetical protein